MNEPRIDSADPIALAGETQGRKFLRLAGSFRWLIAGVAVAAAAATLWWLVDFPVAPKTVVETEATAAKEPAKAPEFGEVFMIRDLIVNPADGRKIFMVSVGLEHPKPEQESEMARREPLLRDNLITFFSSQPAEVLTNIRYRQALRSRVQKIMEYQLGPGVVSRVFFEKWVFQ